MYIMYVCISRLNLTYHLNSHLQLDQSLRRDLVLPCKLSSANGRLKASWYPNTSSLAVQCFHNRRIPVGSSSPLERKKYHRYLHYRDIWCQRGPGGVRPSDVRAELQVGLRMAHLTLTFSFFFLIKSSQPTGTGHQGHNWFHNCNCVSLLPIILCLGCQNTLGASSLSRSDLPGERIWQWVNSPISVGLAYMRLIWNRCLWKLAKYLFCCGSVRFMPFWKSCQACISSQLSLKWPCGWIQNFSLVSHRPIFYITLLGMQPSLRENLQNIPCCA